MWIDTWADSERESHPQGDLNHFYGAFFLGFLWPVISICLVLSPYSVPLTIFQCVRMNLCQDGFHQKSLWVNLASFLFWPPKSFLVWKSRFPWLEGWEICGLLFSSGQGPASSLGCTAIDILEFLSTGNKLKSLSLWVSGGHLPPASKLLNLLYQYLPLCIQWE